VMLFHLDAPDFRWVRLLAAPARRCLAAGAASAWPCSRSAAAGRHMSPHEYTHATARQPPPAHPRCPQPAAGGRGHLARARGALRLQARPAARRPQQLRHGRLHGGRCWHGAPGSAAPPACPPAAPCRSPCPARRPRPTPRTPHCGGHRRQHRPRPCPW
jgi:hypothetical protein